VSADAGHPIDGVILDYHSTLAHGGSPAGWLTDAWARAGRPGTAADGLGPAYAGLLAFLDRIWEHAATVDPDSTRDLDHTRHRAVYEATIALRPEVDPDLADALYATLLAQWTAYDDARPTLAALQARGLRTALLSNVGVDVRPLLARQGLAEHLDAVCQSWQIGVVKPHPDAFRAALGALGLPAERVLMVGDNPVDDTGAARLGIRTLLLPRTEGPRHGLGLVLRVVGPAV